VPAQAKILITFLNRLAFGFISKHEPISIKCIQFFRVVFSEIKVQCLKGSVDQTKSSSQFGSFLEIWKDNLPIITISDPIRPVPKKTAKPDLHGPVIAKFDNSINLAKAEVSPDEINFRDWHMTDHWLELFFKGMERNFPLESECIDILMAMDNNNLNACLKKLLRDENRTLVGYN
jgi:hypothetical protein